MTEQKQKQKIFGVVIPNVHFSCDGKDEITTVRLNLRWDGDQIVFSHVDENTADRRWKTSCATVAFGKHLGFDITPAAVEEPWDQIGTWRVRARECSPEDDLIEYYAIDVSELPKLAAKISTKLGVVKRAEVRSIEIDPEVDRAWVESAVLAKMYETEKEGKIKLEAPEGFTPEKTTKFFNIAREIVTSLVDTDSWRISENDSVVHQDGSGHLSMVWRLIEPPKPVAYSNAPVGLGGRKPRRMPPPIF